MENKMPFIQRCQRVQTEIAKKNIDGLLITKEKNRYYLSGFTGSSGYLLVTSQQVFLLTDFRYIEQAKKETSGCQIIRHGRKWKENLQELFLNLKIRKLGFERDQMPYAQYELIKKQIPSVELIGTENIVEFFRECKDELEIDLIKKAAEIADHAFHRILKLIKPGIKEIELAAELEYQMRIHGAEGPAFETIIASGARAALPHGIASEKEITTGDLVVFDFGSTYHGYRSDMTRTIMMGEAKEKEKKIYSLVLEAQLAGLKHVKAGETGHNIDSIARGIISNQGYGEFFGHGLGHGVGLDIHENPRLAEGSILPLKPGMVVTVEPGVYLEGWGGVRIEDMILVTENGYQNFTKTPKELIEIN